MIRLSEFYSFFSRSRKSFSLILFTSVFLIIMPLETRSEENPDAEKIFNPETSSWLYAYGGYGYYRWKMIGTGNLMDIFSSDLPSEGMKFKHESTPYSVKKYGIRSNIFLFSVGLDYLGDTLSMPTKFDSEKELQEKGDKKARQMKYLSGITLGNFSVQFNITHREFNSTMTSQGYESSNGSISSIFYYPEEGSYQLLMPGDEIAWYTLYTDYEGKLSYKLSFITMDFGFRYTKFDSPTEIGISQTATNGDILMYTENTIGNLFIGIGSYSNIAGDFYLHIYIPVNMFGFYKAKNDYFDSSDASSSFSVSPSSEGNIAITYLLKHLKIEGGVDYGMHFSSLTLSDISLKRDISYRDTYSGNLQTAPAGSYVDLDVSRIEFFWGFYLHASVFF